jgi:vancomycin resistance protein YoaR
VGNQSATEKRRRGRLRLRVLIAVGSIVALVLLAMLIDSALYYNKVHAGVSIAGRSMGGLTHDEATARLTQMVEDAQKNAITLFSGDRTWTVLPADVGTNIDVAAAVSAAMDVSRKSNFVVDFGRRFKLFFSGTDVPLQGTVDSALVNEVLSALAEELDLAPVNAGLAFDGGQVTVVEGQKGLVVDRDTLREQLEALLFTLHTSKLAVPMVVEDPAVQAEDSRQAVAQAQTMIASPVVLREGDRIWSLTPEQIAAYMDFASEDRNGVSTLVPYLSAKKMGPFFANIADTVDSDPVDASFSSDGEKAWVVPGVLGKVVDPDETAKALTAAALKSSGRIAKVAVTMTEPSRTTQEAETMGIRDKLGGFTTEWEGTEDRQTNVRITTKYASDVVLAPGEVYDFDKQIGPRTEERGYKTAPGIVGPGKLEDVFGGGICQVSTTLFNAVFFAGLEVLERKNHSIYIDHYPKGRDATVSAGGPNLRFRNDTKHYILIRGTSDGIVTTFNIYGTDEGRQVTYTTSDFYDVVEREVANFSASWLGPGTTFIKLAGQEGKKIDVIRIVKAKDGSIIHNDKFVSTWRMIPEEVQVGVGSTTTTLPTSTTGTTRPPTPTTGPSTTGL